MKTIVVLFHPTPDSSKRNKLIQEQLQSLPNVTYHIVSSTTIDAAAEQMLLKQYDRIVFQYPMYWYNLPGCGKLYLDAVLDKDMFKGKHVMIVNTVGAPNFYYKKPDMFFHFWERTVEYCGMVYDGSFILYALETKARILKLKELISK
ncbi:NADPH_oxidoreductase [Hexamita inflata]|uniref:NADPH oxidoreductase n=1 Tax=Hexamita inflata TaxID=28002 RepID=A0AA86PY88_9EUKA|nr:NADPH oxidoreductase [Hexamita inflata]CAI9945993.1 NADPH oxidoreductase [Hexamita inflata]